MKRYACIIAASVFFLSACASLPDAKGSPEKMPDAATGLSARTLAAGECGLFVWAADAQKDFIFFGQSQNARAVWYSNKSETTLSLKSQSGTPAQGQYPKQVYAPLTLDLRNPQNITSGTRYRAGTLTQRGPQGWDKVTPVVGLSACKPVQNQ